MIRLRTAALSLLIVLAGTSANAKTICTIVVSAADGALLLEEGDCRTRVTPASTFKIPLAVMGFDAGFLVDAHTPRLPFQEGYPAWGGDDWTQPTDASRWMKYSVVWFSQQVTKSLGEERFRRYVSDLQYGNADVLGDPGKNNGLERSWISSSLEISPMEQVVFLRKLVNRQLPVSHRAMDLTDQIVETATLLNGRDVHGKTGGAYPRQADGTLDRSRGWGWFVGWTDDGGDTLVFARLIQDEKRLPGSPGKRAQAEFLEELPSITNALTR